MTVKIGSKVVKHMKVPGLFFYLKREQIYSKLVICFSYTSGVLHFWEVFMIVFVDDINPN